MWPHLRIHSIYMYIYIYTQTHLVKSIFMGLCIVNALKNLHKDFTVFIVECSL